MATVLEIEIQTASAAHVDAIVSILIDVACEIPIDLSSAQTP